MTAYNIYEIMPDQYVALPANEEGPFDVPDGTVNIDTDGAWTPGSQLDLRKSLIDQALEKFQLGLTGE